jgi:hypothetical protein
LNYLDVKSSNQFPFFRPFQRSWYPYKPQQLPTTTNSKLMKQRQTTVDLPTISTFSIPSTITTTISNLDAKSERTASSSSVLAVA